MASRYQSSPTAPAHAQATRTWVSGVGDDVNPCSRTAPCKTFAGAISKTAAGGEINCLDLAGFGAVTITKDLTIDCEATEGSILAAGTFGVQISAAATDRVTLRGIKINGVNQTAVPGTIGVRILGAAAVSIESCVVTAMGQQGILDACTAANGELYIRNTVIGNNTGSGIALGGAAGTKISVENTSSINNGFGISAATGNSAQITRSILTGNGTGVTADPGAQINIDSSAISSNTTGLTIGGTVRLLNSEISFNGTGVTGSAPLSFGNNRFSENTAAGTAPTPAGGAALGQQ